MTELADLNRPLEASLEALLFVSPSSVTVAQLAAALEKTSAEVQAGLEALSQRYVQNSGLRLQWHAGRVELTTAPELAPVIEHFLGLESTSHLSRPALETLAIIAYQQPVTRPQIDGIRGVNSDGVLKSLLGKGLILETGRAEGPGRPIMYATSSDFLQYFGLSSISELPPLDLEPEEPAPKNGNGVLKD